MLNGYIPDTDNLGINLLDRRKYLNPELVIENTKMSLKISKLNIRHYMTKENMLDIHMMLVKLLLSKQRKNRFSGHYREGEL